MPVDSIVTEHIAACAHCGEPVAVRGPHPPEAEHYCCSGCETAHAVIRSCGLDRYYALLREDAPTDARSRGTGRAYAEFDDPMFRSLHIKRGGGGVCWMDLFLSGVHCAACVWLVERLPRVVPGVLEARLDLRRAMVRVVWRDDQTRPSAIAAALDRLGYAPHPARDGAARAARKQDDRAALIRIAVAGACASNVMLFALAMYAGLFDTMDPRHAGFFRWMSMGGTLVSLLWPGRVFFRSALAAIRARALHLDIPIALALFAGGVWSVFTTIRGHGEIYFDTVSVLVFALLVGRFIQARQQRWSGDAVELLFSLTPTSARRVSPEGVLDVPIESIAPGDILEVRAGDSIPADGEIVEGTTDLDEALLTGESRPVAACPGTSVSAGSTNLSGMIRVRVRATGEATRVGRLMRLVEEGARRRAPIVAFADKASGWFTAGMLALAAITLIAWLFIDPMHAVDHAVALLVVTCPCALGLATPLTLSVALGRAARRDILIKGGDAVERLATPGVIFLDKTGTVTLGSLHVRRWAGDQAARAVAAALASGSAHPAARAIAAFGPRDPRLVAADLRETTGGGVSGRVRGEPVVIGSGRFARSLGLDFSADMQAAEASLIADGLTPIAIAVGGRVVALAGLGDAVRPDARDAINSLRRLGWRVEMLSGDHPSIVAGIAAEVGIDPALARGGLSPEDKLAAVRFAAARERTVMVGDGVNDAAALAAAGVGIAVHGGAEASLATADIYLNRPGLTPIVELVLGSRRTMGVIRRNLAASVAYNATAGALAVLGLVTPIIAAIVMPLSSLTVLFVSFRSRSFGERP